MAGFVDGGATGLIPGKGVVVVVVLLLNTRPTFCAKEGSVRNTFAIFEAVDALVFPLDPSNKVLICSRILEGSPFMVKQQPVQVRFGVLLNVVLTSEEFVSGFYAIKCDLCGIHALDRCSPLIPYHR